MRSFYDNVWAIVIAVLLLGVLVWKQVEDRRDAEADFRIRTMTYRP